MKKSILFYVMLAFSVLTATAQQKVVFCEEFEYISGEASEADAVKVRSAAMNGVSTSRRASIIDAVNSEIGRDRTNTAEESMMRRESIRMMGGTHIMYGRVNSSKESHEVVKGSEKNHDKYTRTISFTIVLTDIASGEQVSRDFQVSDSQYDDAAKAHSKAIGQVDNQVWAYIREYFPLKSHVLDEGFVKQKDEMQYCYISLGSADKVVKGDYFDVYKVALVAGEQVESKIGEMEIVEVSGTHVAKCQVKKGGAEVLLAMNEYLDIKFRDPKHAEPLRVKSATKGDTVWQKIGYAAGGVVGTALGVYAVFLEELGGAAE
ncbi:MAG: hypothetical protein IKK87_09860 [Bacteroidaceae bacterium]|nr:hypothetical protein [Bacteroidaceae bacterium]